MATIDEEKARDWIRKGAQPSEAVARILKRLEDAVEVEGQ